MQPSQPPRSVLAAEPKGVVTTDQGADELLSALAARGGLRFASYARAALLRRIRQRMEFMSVGNFAEYRTFLADWPGEHECLCAWVPVQCTRFFRDAPAWSWLSADAIGVLLDGMRGGERLRVWSAGCATGEEAYSVAMLFAEQVGKTALRSRVEIVGSDVSSAALAVARAGVYWTFGTLSVPPHLRARYFRVAGRRSSVCDELRRAVSFQRHDLLADEPLMGIDLLICRNTLLYFTTKARGDVLRAFGSALLPRGILFPGAGDGLSDHSALFVQDSHGQHLYRRNFDTGRTPLVSH